MVLEERRDRENPAVEETDGGEVEGALPEHAETPPPRRITDEIEVEQRDGTKAGVPELSREIRASVPTEMSEIPVER